MNATRAATRHVEVLLGLGEVSIGRLSFTKAGAREFSSFAYDLAWLGAPGAFAVSPDLPLIAGHQVRKAPSSEDSSFHFALADTEPDAWGRRVIARAHAKRRKLDPALAALTEFDYLCAVDDFARMGALRLRDAAGHFLASYPPGERGASPPLIELDHMLRASRAVETGQESEADLRYLMGKATTLGGMRPKCTLVDADGSLAIGKFPSVADAREVTRAEVLALRLAAAAGIEVPPSRIEAIQGAPVAVITRFDRTPGGGRLLYHSAATLLQARRSEDRSYTEIVDAMRAHCADPVADARQLWRRLVFNLLINNTDDHLHNLGFLHVGGGRWRLAPAFDLNPFPDKERESKTWLDEAQGPITSLAMLMDAAAYFHLGAAQAQAIVKEVRAAVGSWRELALRHDVGMQARDLADFAPAFEHAAALP